MTTRGVRGFTIATRTQSAKRRLRRLARKARERKGRKPTISGQREILSRKSGQGFDEDFGQVYLTKQKGRRGSTPTLEDKRDERRNDYANDVRRAIFSAQI